MTDLKFVQGWLATGEAGQTFDALAAVGVEATILVGGPSDYAPFVPSSWSCTPRALVAEAVLSIARMGASAFVVEDPRSARWRIVACGALEPDANPGADPWVRDAAARVIAARGGVVVVSGPEATVYTAGGEGPLAPWRTR